MSESEDAYFTAEEDEDEMESSPPIPGFVVWTSQDGTAWYLPRCEPDTVYRDKNTQRFCVAHY
jgi:hypothetical protein